MPLQGLNEPPRMGKMIPWWLKRKPEAEADDPRADQRDYLGIPFQDRAPWQVTPGIEQEVMTKQMLDLIIALNRNSAIMRDLHKSLWAVTVIAIVLMGVTIYMGL